MISLKNQLKQLNQEAGVTLVELLAAIAILSIIVTAFLAFFVQAGSTNNRIDDKNEATFLAVEELEHVTHLAQENTLDTYPTEPKNKNGFTIHTAINQASIEDSANIQMNQVIVTVKEGDNIRAQMETWLPLQEDATVEDQD